MNRRIGVAAVVFLFSSTGWAQEPAGCPSVQWILGPTPERVRWDSVGQLASIDYDEDGRPDLVGTEWHPNGGSRTKVVWWKGEGDGTFRASQTIADNQQYPDVFVADATGDGLPDVISGGDGRLLIFPATGSGRGPVIWRNAPELPFGPMAIIQADSDPAMELISLDGRGRFEIFDQIATSMKRVATVETKAPPIHAASADFDGDGQIDVAVSYWLSDVVDLYFGNAAGTFDPPVSLPGIVPGFLLAGDLDEDGRPDLVASRLDATNAGRTPATVSVYLNQGHRNFTHAVVPMGKLTRNSGQIRSLLLDDVSGDGHLDLIVAVLNDSSSLSNDSWTATAVGRGDGTFLTPTIQFTTRPGSSKLYPFALVTPRELAIDDFDGDGRGDLVIGDDLLYTATASCTTQMELLSDLPAISVDQEVGLRVRLSGFGAATPAGYGRVSVRTGETHLGSWPVDVDGTASFSLGGLVPGNHVLIAEFSGNPTVAEATAEFPKLLVTSWSTETTLTLPGSPAVYGEPFPILIEIVNAIAAVILEIDGVPGLQYAEGPLNLFWSEPGNHTIAAMYPGSDLTPPSKSATMSVTVGKGNAVLEMNRSLRVPDTVPIPLPFTIRGAGAIKPTGTVQLFEGTTSIASGTFVKGAVVLNAAFSHGVHDVRAVYSGDAYYRAATLNLKIEGLSGGLFPLEAHGAASGIRIVYAMPLYALPETLQLFRRPVGTTAWAAVPGWNRSTGMDASALSRGVVYEYRLYVVFENGSRSFSNIDSAMLLQSRRRAASP